MSQAGAITASSGDVGTGILTVTSETGGAVGADGVNNIGLLGTPAQGLSFAGSPGTNRQTGTIADTTVTQKGVVELATSAETITGIDTARAVTPAGLQSKVSSTTEKGIVELATDAEAQLLADTTRALTASNIGAVFDPQKNSGFQEWTGAGSYYTINTTDFVLDRPGIGWINNVKVTWVGAQTVAALSAGNLHYIYIDDTGTIGTADSRSLSMFQDNIVLFQVLVDSDGTANVIVVKENHSMMVNPLVMESMHDLGMHGYATEGAGGGTITLHGTVGLQVVGDTDWLDHDLETEIPDSSGAAVDLHIMYTNGAGKWVQDAVQNTLPTEYNLAGTPTALAGNERSIFDIQVSKDDIENPDPKYFAIMNDSKYTNLSTATAALDSGTFSTATNELKALEMIRMGTVIINAATIDSVTVNKQTIGTGSITTIGSTAASVDCDTTNFDGNLSAADTTVQAALETIDDMAAGSGLSQDEVFALISLMSGF